LPAVLEELATALRHPLSSEEAHRRELARDVFPHMQRFYDGWLDEQAWQSFYRTSPRRYPGKS
jgi:5-methylthioadenosine/S-adenosylhomocysteine deaminase